MTRPQSPAEVRAATYAESGFYQRGGVRALHDAAQVIYARMRKGQRGRPAQAARVAALARRLREMQTPAGPHNFDERGALPNRRDPRDRPLGSGSCDQGSGVVA